MMQLVEKHIINENHDSYKECLRLCTLSKNLYNHANYLIRQSFIVSEHTKNTTSKFLSFPDINRLFVHGENNKDYVSLPCKVSKGILRGLNTNWVSYFASIKSWSKNPSVYSGKPKMPNYKDSHHGLHVVPYEKDAISKPQLEKYGYIHPSQTSIYLKSGISHSELQALRIVPRNRYFVIEVIYNKEVVAHDVDVGRYLGIDIGVSNLASCASSDGDTFIINGKPIKSINRLYNKNKSKMQSKLDAQVYSSKKIIQLTNKRNNRISNYLHKSSRYIIDYCLSNKVGTIIIGKNDGWKQKINLGAKTNQNFVGIPFYKFISMITYKANLVGITVDVVNESYTSKCSFLDDEDMKHHELYLGKRIKRGLFQTNIGLKINADINGALNIIRKSVKDFTSKSINVNSITNYHPLIINFQM